MIGVSRSAWQVATLAKEFVIDDPGKRCLQVFTRLGDVFDELGSALGEAEKFKRSLPKHCMTLRCSFHVLFSTGHARRPGKL